MGHKPLTVLVVAAHPDDEVLGAGIWLRRQVHSNLYLLHITDGSPRDMENARALGFSTRRAYARARREELRKAVKLIGIANHNCIQLKVPDKDAFLHLREVIAEIDALVERIEPALLLSPAYEGGHPDHDTAAAAVAAVQRRRASFKHWEFPLYHAGRRGQMVTGAFLPYDGRKQNVITLTPAESRLKRQMISCFKTQREMLKFFRVDAERFRKAPSYDFKKAPHPGRLLYESWGWGVSGNEWRREVNRRSAI
jgi:LmbE family N-acetylglucosaminyl deacetylase